MSRKNRPVTKDMYWFAHGGAETTPDKSITQKGDSEENDCNSFEGKNSSEHRSPYLRDISLTDGSNSSGPASLEREDRLHATDKRTAVEERRRLLLEAEQERNEAVMKKHMEREAALEARRNAQRSTISFAFGSSVPRNVDALQVHHAAPDMDSMTRSFTAGSSSQRTDNHFDYFERRSVSPPNCGGYFLDSINLQTESSFSSRSVNLQSCCLVGSGALIGEDLMTRSMTASTSASRGRRKNDLMPTVPYDRMATPRVATSSSSRRRSVSMTRLDQLAQPRKHYVEATKALSTASSGMLKDGTSPNRPLSSASEHSGGRVSSSVTRRVRSSPRKPRPVSIAGTIPDQRHISAARALEVKATPLRRTTPTVKKSTESSDVKKTPISSVKSAPPKSTERLKTTPRPSTAPAKNVTPKSTTPKPAATPKSTSKVKKVDSKLTHSKSSSSHDSTPKTQSSKPALTNKKKTDLQVSTPEDKESKEKSDREEKSISPTPDSDGAAESDKNGKRIISEEEAKAALAEKRKLAREQAEREAELERQKQEELKRLEEERLQLEEEEQRKFEEEQLRLIEEHRRQEEEKFRKAIEDQEQREEEERVKRDEEMRLKAEQERKAKEEAEKLRLEIEEKLRKEEEERAERKKRLEKIMSRTRGKSSGTSPSGSISGSDQLDSGENQQEGFSSGANSLESNDGREQPCESGSSDDGMAKMEVSSGANSMEANITYEFGSNDASLSSNDLMLPPSESASHDNSMVIMSEKETVCEESSPNTEISEPLVPDSSSADKELLVNEPQSIASDGEVDVVQEQEIRLENKIEEAQLEDAEVTNDEIETKEVPHDQLINETSENVMQELDNAVEERLIPEKHVQFSNDIQSSEEMLSNKENLNNPHEESNTLEFMKENLELSADPVLQESNVDDDDDDNDISSVEDLKVKDIILSENQDLNGFEAEQQNAFTENQETLMSTSMYGEFSSEENQNPFSVSDSFNKKVEESSFFENQAVNDLSENILNNHFEQELIEESKIVKENSNQPFDIYEQDFQTDYQVPIENPFQNDLHKEIEIASSDIINPTDNETSDMIEVARNIEDPSHSTFLSNSKDVASDPFKSVEVDKSAGDNLFISSLASTTNELNVFHSGDGDKQEHIVLESEQISPVNQSLTTESSSFHDKENLDNVTLIKEVGSESYVGIISSIDNDHLSNNFPKAHERLTNNFECASTTDTEDSSLDSNLSQVAAVENGDNDAYIGLSNGGTSAFVVDTTSNNIGHSDNPFQNDSVLNQCSIPQFNHFASEMYTNGHDVESSKANNVHGFGGDDILGVDHSKNNIFENVNTMEYGKVSPDPFLVKGSPIPGNPFLVQDEQKQVLMSTDFIN